MAVAVDEDAVASSRTLSDVDIAEALALLAAHVKRGHVHNVNPLDLALYSTSLLFWMRLSVHRRPMLDFVLTRQHAAGAGVVVQLENFRF